MQDVEAPPLITITRLQKELDTWHANNPGPIENLAGYRGFLEKIGYLVTPPAGAKTPSDSIGSGTSCSWSR